MPDTADSTDIEIDDIPVIDTHIHVWTADDPAFPMHVPAEKLPWWRGTTAEYVEEIGSSGTPMR